MENILFLAKLIQQLVLQQLVQLVVAFKIVFNVVLTQSGNCLQYHNLNNFVMHAQLDFSQSLVKLKTSVLLTVIFLQMDVVSKSSLILKLKTARLVLQVANCVMLG